MNYFVSMYKGKKILNAKLWSHRTPTIWLRDNLTDYTITRCLCSKGVQPVIVILGLEICMDTHHLKHGSVDFSSVMCTSSLEGQIFI